MHGLNLRAEFWAGYTLGVICIKVVIETKGVDNRQLGGGIYTEKRRGRKTKY